MKLVKELEQLEGFSSAASIFGWNVKGWVKLHLSAAFIGVVLDSALRFVDAHILSPKELYFIISFMVAVDFCTGLWLAARRKQIETNKALRGLYKWLAYTLMIALANNLAKYGGNFVFSWLPTATVTPMAVVLFLSIFKNLQQLGFVSGAVLTAVLNQIDRHKEGLTDATRKEIESEETPKPKPPQN